MLAPARAQHDVLGRRRPDAEAGVPVAERKGAEAALEGQRVVGHERSSMPDPSLRRNVGCAPHRINDRT
jgi:hypothetical protein